jgi:hypothetical protein
MGDGLEKYSIIAVCPGRNSLNNRRGAAQHEQKSSKIELEGRPSFQFFAKRKPEGASSTTLCCSLPRKRGDWKTLTIIRGSAFPYLY